MERTTNKMSELNELVPVTDKDSKIEVLLKNDEPVEKEVELSLLNVFANMKKSFRLYAWIILLCMAVGLLAPYSILATPRVLPTIIQR